MSRLYQHLRHAAEAIPLLIGALTVPWLPRRAVLTLARFLGTAGYRLCPGLRRIAMANLSVAFGDGKTERERTAIAREAFQTFALVILDLLWFGVFTRRRVESWVRFDASIARHVSPQSPVIVVTGHLGNWEIFGVSTALRGLPFVSVAAPVENPFVDRLLNRLRRATGQGIREKGGAVRVLLRVLRGGGRTALLMDQNTLPDQGGEFVDFFGVPAPVSKAAALLSERTKAAIVPAFCLPRPDGSYEAHARPPLSSAGRGTTLTQEVAKAIEEEVSRHPGCWLWMYKRWKYVPVGADRGRYPFYAKKKAVPAQ